ncbi:hypothetical protein [Stackebrandtia nassauensis]|uniref:Uncharacterized protein n=1 Tax=Stackebrandtia nassauensis (strain DSM 44728 / CIP 108903 / NRRL B-16338 / NBRC 102104 / LLR-40K-21) TaxID=446470 RepID=D3Q3Q1_STANL|nr:hypothetical protein [Stackebrandtia nassauensis]ADD43968.1 hypothetical protein Snas_4321 [Stackebrandtia nassauensis DSM 44728]
MAKPPPGKSSGRGSINDDEGKIEVESGDIPHVTDTEIKDAAEKVRETAVSKGKSERDKAEGDYTIMNPDSMIRPDFASDEEIEEQAKWIPGRFEPYITPNPLDIETLVKRADTIATVFNCSGNNLTDSRLSGAYEIAMTRSDEWEGKAGENFEKYMASLPTIMGNHGKVANMLQIEAQKMIELYKNRRKGAKDIADQAVKAIEAIDDSKGEGLEFLLAVIITIGTFVGLGGGGLAIVGAGVASGATLGGPFLPDDKEELPLGADTIEEVLENMKKALDELDKSITEQEDTLIDAMKFNESEIRPHISDDFGKETLLLPMRPELAGADVKTIKERFHQFTDGDR